MFNNQEIDQTINDRVMLNRNLMQMDTENLTRAVQSQASILARLKSKLLLYQYFMNIPHYHIHKNIIAYLLKLPWQEDD